MASKRIYFLVDRRPTSAELAVIYADHGGEQNVEVVWEGITRGRGDHELTTHNFYGPLEYGEKIIIYIPSHGHHHRVRETLDRLEHLAHLPHPHLPPRFRIGFHHPRQR